MAKTIGTPHENNTLVCSEGHPCTLDLFPGPTDRMQRPFAPRSARPVSISRPSFRAASSARTSPITATASADKFSSGSDPALFWQAATSESQYTDPKATESRSAQPSPTFRSEFAQAITSSSRISCCGRNRARARFAPISTD